MPDVGPMDVYRLLPKENCGDCGLENCMSFATELLERGMDVDDCPILQGEEWEENRKKLKELLIPPVREVVVGSGDEKVKIGGEEVIYRHEKTWFNETAFFIDVSDQLNEKELNERVNWIENYSREKIGKDLDLDGIVVRGKSGDVDKFGETLRKVVEISDLPICLCSFDSDLLKKGVDILEDSNPLLYAANLRNWEDVSKLSIEKDCPMVLSESNLNDLIDLSRRCLTRGVDDDKIVLDLNMDSEDLKSAHDKFVKLRRAAIEDNFDPLKFPILGVPATEWVLDNESDESAFLEATVGASLISKGIDMLIFHNVEPWAMMPSLVLRQDLYQDPRNPADVKPELKEVGDPDENSPILITTNFALTYFTVEGDCEDIDAFIYPIETGGTSVTASIAGDILTADKVVEAIEKENFSKAVNHKTIILPGAAAVLSKEIEEKSGWKTMVGPEDSSGIQSFIEENWN